MQISLKNEEIRIVPLTDVWSERDLVICTDDYDSLPPFGRELIDLLVADTGYVSRSSPIEYS